MSSSLFSPVSMVAWVIVFSCPPRWAIRWEAFRWWLPSLLCTTSPSWGPPTPLHLCQEHRWYICTILTHSTKDASVVTKALWHHNVGVSNWLEGVFWRAASTGRLEGVGASRIRFDTPTHWCPSGILGGSSTGHLVLFIYFYSIWMGWLHQCLIKT